MKFVKRISLFFIYPLSMFSLGFISNMAIMEFFYPGKHNEQVQIQAQIQPVKEMKEEPIEVSVSEEPVVTANTHYVLQEYNIVTTGLSHCLSCRLHCGAFENPDRSA